MASDPTDPADVPPAGEGAPKPSHPPKDPGPRHLAREAALQVLFALDTGRGVSRGARGDASSAAPGAESTPTYDPAEVDAAIKEYWDHLEGPALGRLYGDELVKGVCAKLADIDKALRAANPNWRIERMARVDRNVLRLAAWELLHSPEAVHPRVVIDEAVELAKRFGAEEASAFVNGVLDRLARTHSKL